MRQFLLLFAMLISLHTFAAMDTLIAKTRITDVTVFFSGAEVSRSQKINLSKGKHLILLEKLPEEINPQSIQVEQIRNAQILSVKNEMDYSLSTKKLPREREIEKAIEAEKRKYSEIRNRSEVYRLEEKILMDNADFRKKDGGASLTEIKEAANFYRARLNEIKSAQLKLQDEVDAINERLQDLYEELNKVTAEKRVLYSRILIAVECNTNISSDLKVSYYISSAGWEPSYDFRVENVSMPLSIVYNAQVFQSSGEDWKNVNVTLSTNNPSLSGDKPEVKRWYLNRPSPYTVDKAVKEGIGGISGRVYDATTGEALPFANVSISLNGQYVGGSTTDFEGKYAVKPLKTGRYTIQVTYVGYQSTTYNGTMVQADEMTNLDVPLSNSSTQLAEVVVAEAMTDKDYRSSKHVVKSEEMNRLPTRDVGNTRKIRGSRASGNQTYIDGVKVGQGVMTADLIKNSIRTSVTNLEYKIEIPYSIPSDGQDYNIKIKEVKSPAEYIFYAVPKLENDVFLTARIANWTELDLLSGKTNIFYQGTYVAESKIDAYQASDTLELSLGRDKNIVVQRQGNKEKNERSLTGNTVKENFAWDIKVKNNRNAQVKIIIEDQIPLSEWKSVSIELVEGNGAKYNEKSGFLKWELEIPPGGKQDITFTYQVKYDKGTNLSLE